MIGQLVVLASRESLTNATFGFALSAVLVVMHRWIVGALLRISKRARDDPNPGTWLRPKPTRRMVELVSWAIPTAVVSIALVNLLLWWSSR